MFACIESLQQPGDQGAIVLLDPPVLNLTAKPRLFHLLIACVSPVTNVSPCSKATVTAIRSACPTGCPVRPRSATMRPGSSVIHLSKATGNCQFWRCWRRRL